MVGLTGFATADVAAGGANDRASSLHWAISKGPTTLVHSGEYSTLEVAELFGVGRSTVYRAIERQRVAAKAGLAEAIPKH